MEMGRGLWLFEFESTKEVERIFKEGTRMLGGFSISIKKWSKETGCNTGRDVKGVAWVGLLRLSVHLWSRPVLRRIGDSCEGFLAVDEDTAFMSELHWARIQVKWGGRTSPQFVEVF